MLKLLNMHVKINVKLCDIILFCCKYLYRLNVIDIVILHS